MTEDTPHVGIPEQLARRMSMPEQHEYLRAKHARPKLSRRGAPAGEVSALAESGKRIDYFEVKRSGR